MRPAPPVRSAPPSPGAVMARAAGENFPVASRLLPRDTRRHLLAIYGFARLVDDIGDEAAGDRVALLDWLEGEVDRIYAGTPTHPLMQRLVPTVRRFQIPRQPFDRLIAANRQDQEVRTYASFDDLVAYCELSANPVGHLVLYVLGVLWTAWYFTVFGVPAIARLAACRLRRWPRTGCSHRSARREPPGWPSPSRPPGSSCAALLARRSGSSGRFWAAPAPRPAGTDERRPRPAGTGARSPRRSMLPGPAEVKEAVAWAVAGSPAGPRRGRFSATAAARLGRARPPGARGPCPRFGRALGTPGSAGCAWPTR